MAEAAGDGSCEERHDHRRRRRRRRAPQQKKERRRSAAIETAMVPSTVDAQHDKILKGKTIAVSALRSSSGDDDDDDDDDDDVQDNDEDDAVVKDTTSAGSYSYYTYKRLRALCESLGAKVTGQVHRRTDCVVATHSAAAAEAATTTTTTTQQPTQRVRKAWKLQIPVVSVQWIEDCRSRRQCLPFEPCYLWLEPKTTLPKRRRDEPASAIQQQQEQQPYNKKKKASNGIAEDNGNQQCSQISSVLVERKLDLGCCCLCHDEESDLRSSDCEWCVDCSVRNDSVLGTLR